MSVNNINAFALSLCEQFIFAGTLNGELIVLSSQDLSVITREQVSYGAINVVAAHQKNPIIATYGEDHWLILLTYDQETGLVTVLHEISTRQIRPKQDPFNICRSTSQALAFHGNENRLAGHGGSAGLFELEFDQTGYQVLYCERLHGQMDMITLCYIEQSDYILSGDGAGCAILSKQGKEIQTWQASYENQKSIHWFERVKEGVYYLASDTGRVIRLNLQQNELFDGPLIARDHMEHVTYNRTSNKLYCSSFDRTVYQIDLKTLAVIKIIWHAPFKLRWIKTLEYNPNCMIIQCRNGGLYQIDLNQTAEQKPCSVFKETGLATWSICRNGLGLLSAGEGNYFSQYFVEGVEPCNKQLTFTEKRIKTAADESSYCKRVVYDSASGYSFLGRVDGSLWRYSDQGEISKVLQCDSAIRDLCIIQDQAKVAIALENGQLLLANFQGQGLICIYKTESPLWALSYQVDNKVLAVAHRLNKVIFFSSENYNPIIGHLADVYSHLSQRHTFIKRLRWADKNRLFIACSGALFEYSYRQNYLKQFSEKLLPNTVEDFDWDENKRYLVLINYSRELYLYDFSTGELLDRYSDSVDYSKGIMFLTRDEQVEYKADFLVCGRYAGLKYYRVNNERIIQINNQMK